MLNFQHIKIKSHTAERDPERQIDETQDRRSGWRNSDVFEAEYDEPAKEGGGGQLHRVWRDQAGIFAVTSVVESACYEAETGEHTPDNAVRVAEIDNVYACHKGDAYGAE